MALDAVDVMTSNPARSPNTPWMAPDVAVEVRSAGFRMPVRGRYSFGKSDVREPGNLGSRCGMVCHSAVR
jgi:hypothetical protein